MNRMGSYPTAIKHHVAKYARTYGRNYRLKC